MTEPNTTKMAKDMSAEKRAAFIAQCKKLEGASSQSKPVETPASAKDMTPAQRDAWMAEHRRKFR
jgi:hypothetical protein